jgi:hypothetical protein
MDRASFKAGRGVLGMVSGAGIVMLAGAAQAGPAVTSHGRLLTTIPPYAVNTVVEHTSQAVTGPEWISRTVVGGQLLPQRLGWPAQGPAAYGAAETDASLVYVRVGPKNRLVAFSPWINQPDESVRLDFNVALPSEIKQVREAREQWLRENGYIGAVREFRNTPQTSGTQPADSTILRTQPVKIRSGLPEPRAVLELSPEVTKFRARQRVDARPTNFAPGEATRISVPHAASPTMVARLERNLGAPEARASRVIRVVAK